MSSNTVAHRGYTPRAHRSRLYRWSGSFTAAIVIPFTFGAVLTATFWAVFSGPGRVVLSLLFLAAVLALVVRLSIAFLKEDSL